MTRRVAALGILVATVVAAVVAVVVIGPIARGPDFHRYADHRELLGIPGAGDVLTNFPFVFVGLAFLPRRRDWITGGACVAVAAIGLGSTAYHFAPGDATLVVDWIPIVLALVFVLGAVVRDRLGPRAAGATLAVGAALAIGSVAWWLAGGGTTAGGDMGPYVAVQGLGVALPLIVAAVVPGTIPLRWLAAAVACFAVARLFARYDAELLAALGVSGHSLKHLAAAGAAALALGALTAPAGR